MTNLVVDEGDFADAGKAVLAVVDSDSFRVEAYLEETKLNFVKVWRFRHRDTDEWSTGN